MSDLRKTYRHTRLPVPAELYGPRLGSTEAMMIISNHYIGIAVIFINRFLKKNNERMLKLSTVMYKGPFSPTIVSF